MMCLIPSQPDYLNEAVARRVSPIEKQGKSVTLSSQLLIGLNSSRLLRPEQPTQRVGLRLLREPFWSMALDDRRKCLRGMV